MGTDYNSLFKKAEMGMGTLIIFVSMILVAAVAAGVLITTTNALQSKALQVGTETRREVGTNLQAIEVFAEDASARRNVGIVYVTVKLNPAAGGDPIRFDHVVLKVTMPEEGASYKYNSTLARCQGSLLSYRYGYGVNYTQTSTAYKKGYLNQGEVARVCFKPPRNISEGKKTVIDLIPAVGGTLSIEAVSPDIMVKKRIFLWP
jgi:archaeal flagellin FlaB